MQPERPSRTALFPNTGQAVLLVVAMLVLQVAIGAVFALPGAISGAGEMEGGIALNPWLLGIVNIIAIGAALSFGLRVTGEPARRFFKVRPFDLSLLPPVLLTSVSLAVVIDQGAKVFFEMMKFFPQWPVVDLSEALMARHPIGGFILVVVVAPFTEEYLFRGMILRGLLTRHRPVVAVIFSAVLFGVMHANILQFQLGLVIGIAFGWWFVRTRSVGPGLVGHAVFNAVAYFSTVFPNFFAPLGPSTGPEVVHQPPWFTLSAVMFVALGVWWFKGRADDLAELGIPAVEDEPQSIEPAQPDLPPAIELQPVVLPPLLVVETAPMADSEPLVLPPRLLPPLLDPPVLPPESPAG